MHKGSTNQAHTHIHTDTQTHRHRQTHTHTHTHTHTGDAQDGQHKSETHAMQEQAAPATPRARRSSTSVHPVACRIVSCTARKHTRTRTHGHTDTDTRTHGHTHTRTHIDNPRTHTAPHAREGGHTPRARSVRGYRRGLWRQPPCTLQHPDAPGRNAQTSCLRRLLKSVSGSVVFFCFFPFFAPTIGHVQ